MEIAQKKPYNDKYAEKYGGDTCPRCLKPMEVEGPFYICKDCGTRLSKICQDMKAEWFR